MTDKYSVTGMSCAACQARVEKAVNNIDGVERCNVNLLTNTMDVEGSASHEAVIQAVTNAGYGASLIDAPFSNAADAKELLNNAETEKLKKRLTASVIILLIIIAVSRLSPSVYVGIAEAVLALAVIIINRAFFVRGLKGIMHGSANMDTLVALGAGISYIWSLYILCTTHSSQGLYFVSSAMILAFITAGKFLESITKGRTTDAIRELLEMVPETATVIRDGTEIQLPVEEIQKGDICVIRAGEKIPADGIIASGEASVNEAALTGESLPVDKKADDEIKAATICESGFIKFEVTAVGEDTALAGIVRLVSEAASTKAPISRLADRIAAVFVPAVMLIAAIVLVVWLMLGQTLSFSLTRAIAVLLISCPCALGLATPVAIMVGSGVGARHGILFKTAAALEEMGRIEIIAFDKTGTITNGRPELTDIIAADGANEDELKITAYSLEAMSDHPLARAVTAAFSDSDKYELIEYVNINGRGLMARIDDDSRKRIAGGNAGFIEEFLDLEDDEEDDAAIIAWIEETAAHFGKAGRTAIFFANGDRLLGALALADEIKADSAEAVTELKQMGEKLAIISGDNLLATRAVAERLGIEDVYAGVLPAGKDKAVKKLMEKGRTAMVGDGINDAPALTRADVGVAIAAGTDVAIAAAELVLVNSSIKDVVKSVKLGRATLKIIKQNLFWAFFYNILLIPLASGLFTGLLGGWTVSPALAAAAMSLSSFTVCTNALRLNHVKL